MRIRFDFGGLVLDAELLDTPTAQAVAKALPLTSSVMTWGEEIYFAVPMRVAREPDARAVVTPWAEPLVLAKPYLLALIALGIAINFTPRNLLDRLEVKFHRWPLVLQGLAAGLIVVLVETMGGDGVAPFIYFQF